MRRAPLAEDVIATGGRDAVVEVRHVARDQLPCHEIVKLVIVVRDLKQVELGLIVGYESDKGKR